ncbi:hypothetical protein P154DRAFT_582854 [Amniculicola lignicola CBS 123094]|uniref:HTH psq-type domain-containing protein n=1 Tax=Amniculicola lignicola CBS 123094 TaxID=1392246 RepID=A0A6A5VX02_9PLEO|nr:hypothetical protein P154DRAFT_582854 [Amniculicola lignicola CBS 123094]
MAPIDEALAALKSLNLGEKINFTQIAQEYSCDRSTLSRRWRGVQVLDIKVGWNMNENF